MTLVIGIGNADRGDDAVGLEVARRVQAAALPGVAVTRVEDDQLALLDAWEGADGVYVVDAVRSGGTPGTVYRFDTSAAAGARFRHRGTHTFSLADVVELARALHRLPARLVGYGIEGADFGLGTGLSPEAEAGAQAATRRLLGELKGKG
jgi:hydrogenase maturation protease